MSRLPKISGAELVHALGHLGYQVVRQRGSHASLRAEGRAPLTVPMHPEIAPGTLRAILRAADFDVDELIVASMLIEAGPGLYTNRPVRVQMDR